MIPLVKFMGKKKKKNETMKTNRGFRNKPLYLWSIDFGQGVKTIQ